MGQYESKSAASAKSKCQHLTKGDRKCKRQREGEGETCWQHSTNKRQKTNALFPIRRRVQETVFDGTIEQVQALTLYLAARHPGHCMPFLPGTLPEWEDIVLVLDRKQCAWGTRDSKLGKIFERALACMNRKNRSRFILLPLLLHALGKNLHMNIIIVDTARHTVERFEPHGNEDDGKFCDVDAKIEFVLVKYPASPFHEYEYLRPIDFCPRVGPQGLQEAYDPGNVKGRTDGFCVAWTYWYVDLRLRYPDIGQKQLIRRAMKELLADQGRTLTEYIFAYASFFEALEPLTPDGIKAVISELA